MIGGGIGPALYESPSAETASFFLVAYQHFSRWPTDHDTFVILDCSRLRIIRLYYARNPTYKGRMRNTYVTP